MAINSGFRFTILAAIISLSYVSAAHATLFSGTLYYTTYNGGQNVWNIAYSYNDATNAFNLAAPNNIASTNGADGIIFAPNGNILVGGQGSGNVYEVTTGGTLVNTQFSGDQSYHLTLDPSGNKVYTSNFGGPLDTVSIPIGSGSTTTAISGDERGLTQVAFGDSGNVFYVNGSPNGGGNLGTIDLSTGVTTRLYSSVTPAHGLIYDPYTDLITMFGAGQTGTMNATNGSGLLTSGSGVFNACDFDQGAVDGQGHALVAGCNGITFIDYSASMDITNPDFTTTIYGFSAIDDVAPLVGAGSNPNPAPEPASVALVGLGLAGLAISRRRRANLV
jgi:hypothetical protein